MNLCEILGFQQKDVNELWIPASAGNDGVGRGDDGFKDIHLPLEKERSTA